ASRTDLDDGREAAPADDLAAAARHDDERLVRQQPERGEVEVVPVNVRDQHRVDVERRVRPRCIAAEVHDAVAEERVGKERDAGGLDQDGGVPEPGAAGGLRQTTASVSAYASWPPAANQRRSHTCSSPAPTTGSSGSSQSLGTSANAKDCVPPRPPCEP